MNSTSEQPKTWVKIPQLGTFQYSGITLEETLGGGLPTGRLSFLKDPESENLNIDKIDVKLVMNQETEIEVSCFCEEVTNYRGENHWDLTFVPKEFYQEPHKAKFSGIKNLINKLNPYNASISVDSDCNLEGQNLYQNNVSDYHQLLKYLLAAKRRVIPAFQFDKLYFCDLEGSPKRSIDVSSVQRMLVRTVTRNKFWAMNPTSSSRQKNKILNVHYNNSIYSIGKDFRKAFENQLINSQLVTSMPGKISYRFPDYMNLHAGDLVTLTGVATENQTVTTGNYVVLSSKLECDLSNVFHTITFGAYDSD